MILSNTSHCFHCVVLTGSWGHPEHKLSNPSMASWLLLRGGYQSQWVCCFSIFPVWLHGIKRKGFLVSSGVILLNPGTVCQEQRARCQHSCIRAVFSVRGQTVMWLPLKVTAGIFGHIRVIQIIVPDPVLGTETLEMGKTLSLPLKGPQRQQENSKTKIIIASLLFKVYTEGRIIGRLQRESRVWTQWIGWRRVL